MLTKLRERLQRRHEPDTYCEDWTAIADQIEEWARARSAHLSEAAQDDD